MRKILDGDSSLKSSTNQPVAKFIEDHLSNANIKSSIVSDTSGPMRNVSFGHEYAYNAYPAPKRSPSPSRPLPTEEHRAVGGTQASKALEKVARDVQAYHESL